MSSTTPKKVKAPPAPLPGWLVPAVVTVAVCVLAITVSAAAAGVWRHHRSAQLDALRDRRATHEHQARGAEAKRDNASSDLAKARKDLKESATMRAALRRDIRTLPRRIQQPKADEAELRSVIRTADSYS